MITAWLWSYDWNIVENNIELQNNFGQLGMSKPC